jgi:hypothetical protein
LHKENDMAKETQQTLDPKGIPQHNKIPRPQLHEMDDMCRAVINRIDADKQRLQPTPMKGDIVGWCREYSTRADGQVIWNPAVVVDSLDPGRLVLEVYTGSGQHLIAQSALYVHHPANLKDANVKIGSGGGWFYREAMVDDEFQPGRAAFAWHVKRLHEQEQAALRDLLSRRAAELDRMQRIKKMQESQQQAAGV